MIKVPNNTLKGLLIHILLAVILIIGALLLFFFVYLPSNTNHGETITVPSIEGIHMDNIDEFLTKRNLRYEVNDSTYTDEYPPLTIVKQYPRAGSKVKEHRKIFISVNRVNPPTVPVPDLVLRSSLRNAEAVLESNELKRGKIIYKPSEFLNLVLALQVNGENIQEGELIPKGSVLDLVVGDGKGNDKSPLPDLIGYEFENAKLYLAGLRLELGLITVEGDTSGQKCIVTKQLPAAGKIVASGEAIDLWIEPESDTLDIPTRTAGL